MTLIEESSQDLLQAHDELWRQALGYAKSIALVVALHLRIPDAIHRRGGGATLRQILAETALHPCKLRALRRLMRVLTVSGTFSVVQQQPPAPAASGGSAVDASDDDEAVVYRLTAASRFLVSDDEASLADFVNLALQPMAAAPHTAGFCAWFRQEQNVPPPYALVFRQEFPTFWEHGDDINELLNKGMVAQTRFLMPIMLRECGGEVFRGIDSLVDVGGGHGAAAAAIAAAFPDLNCSVLDLPHVVAAAPSHGDVQFVGGNFFESIPPATAVFLKTILHDWDDDECVKILKNCRKAISPRDAGGKVILLDMVLGYGQPNKKKLETQVINDMFIMMVNGAERDEQEWKKIFDEAGFNEYKILPVVGALSVIEVYP